MNKKGQLGNLTGIIFVIVVSVVLVSAGFLILADFSEELDDTSVTITNETFSNVTDKGGGFQVAFANNSANARALGFNSFSLTGVAGQNNSERDLLGNFSALASNGTFILDAGFTPPTINGTSMEVSYTFKKGEAAYKGVDKSIDAFETIPDLLPLIILIGLIVIILFLVFTIPGARGSASA